MKRGEIYFIKSTHQEEGSEQRADRPAVIVSNDVGNEHSDIVEVVYLTTKPKADIPTHVITRGATYPSTILCEQIFTVSKRRIGEKLGEITDTEREAMDRALAISLGLCDCQASETAVPVLDEEYQKLTIEHAMYNKFTDDLLDILRKGARV